MTMDRSVFVWRGFSRTMHVLTDRAEQRIREARATTALEIGIVLYGFASVYQSVVQGGGYTQGWAILGKVISQPAYGYILAIQCVLRLTAVLILSREWRYRLAWSSLLIHGTTAYAVHAANPTSPMLAALTMVVVADLWVIGAEV